MELLYLEWVDSDGSFAWHWKSTWRNRLTRVKTVGWLLDEDDETITVVGSFAPSLLDGDVQLLGYLRWVITWESHICYLTIPKVALSLRKSLEQP